MGVSHCYRLLSVRRPRIAMRARWGSLAPFGWLASGLQDASSSIKLLKLLLHLERPVDVRTRSADHCEPTGEQLLRTRRLAGSTWPKPESVLRHLREQEAPARTNGDGLRANGAAAPRRRASFISRVDAGLRAARDGLPRRRPVLRVPAGRFRGRRRRALAPRERRVEEQARTTKGARGRRVPGRPREDLRLRQDGGREGPREAEEADGQRY